MSAPAVDPASPTTQDATVEPATDDDRGEAEERGRLTVGLSVVRKIAERVADTTPGTTSVHRRLAGVQIGQSGASAKVSAVSAAGAQVDLRLDLPLHYPAPIVPTVEAVRQAVGAEVERQTGYRVRSVDVTVSALLHDPSSHLE